MAKTDTTTIEAELAALKPGETLVVLTKDGTGYWLGVGDAHTSNVWVLTPMELERIVVLGARHLGRKLD